MAAMAPAGAAWSAEAGGGQPAAAEDADRKAFQDALRAMQKQIDSCGSGGGCDWKAAAVQVGHVQSILARASERDPKRDKLLDQIAGAQDQIEKCSPKDNCNWEKAAAGVRQARYYLAGPPPEPPKGLGFRTLRALDDKKQAVIAYVDDKGAPIALDNYDWAACKHPSAKSQDPSDKPHTLLAKVVGGLSFASDEYALAYQSACGSVPGVPADVDFANSGVTLSYTYNGFSQSGVGAKATVKSKSSGKLVGAVGLDLASLFGKPDPKGNKFSVIPYVGIDYEFNGSAESPNSNKLTSSYNVKQIYYGIGSSQNLRVDPSCNDYTALNQVQIGQDANDQETVDAPRPSGSTKEPKYVNAYLMSQMKPMAADGKDCVSGDPSLKGYYYWVRERTSGKGRVYFADYVNLTENTFLLSDQLWSSRIWVTNARIVPFAVFPMPFGTALGLNQYGRPPLYTGNYSYRSLLGSQEFDPPCKTSTIICGIDVHWIRDSRLALILDGRVDFGHFIDRGLPRPEPGLTDDFVRLGGRAGGIVELNLIRNTPITLQATYTNFAPVVGFSGPLGLSEFEVDYPLSAKNLQLSVTYANGRNQETADRVKTWSIGLKISPPK